MKAAVLHSALLCILSCALSSQREHVEGSWPSAPIPVEEGYDALVGIDLARLRAQLPGVSRRLDEISDSLLARSSELYYVIYRPGAVDASAVTWLVETTSSAQDRMSPHRVGPPIIPARPKLAVHALRRWTQPRGSRKACAFAVASLSRDARRELTRRFGLDPAPHHISAWLDIEDDVALIVELDVNEPLDPSAATRLIAHLKAWTLPQGTVRPHPRVIAAMLPSVKISERQGRVRITVLTTRQLLKDALDFYLQ